MPWLVQLAWRTTYASVALQMSPGAVTKSVARLGTTVACTVGTGAAREPLPTTVAWTVREADALEDDAADARGRACPEG